MNFQKNIAVESVPGPSKFCDPKVTLDGSPRAFVRFERYGTLWFNTGTLCNLSCTNCYIESTPTNDRLQYLSAAEVSHFLDQLETDGSGREIGFTGGEPFMNPEFMAMLNDSLTRGFEVLILTNAMKPMWHRRLELLALRRQFGDRLTIRVSLDHYHQEQHETERGENVWDVAIKGLRWLSEYQFNIHVAGRTFWGESEKEMRRGFAELFADLDVKIDAMDPACLILFPEMDGAYSVPEITTACWDILKVKPSEMMCATSRMVVHRKGEDQAKVLACTLLAYDPQFEMGLDLLAARREVALNHPHCAKFCVLGGGSCSIA